jgi:hypothetical protein
MIEYLYPTASRSTPISLSATSWPVGYKYSIVPVRTMILGTAGA